MTTQDAGADGPVSRRARREAEREVERELLRTGQVPVLTRKEIRRQRAEAEAMRNAIAAGEITEEEARALQNPYLNEDAPVAPAPAEGEEGAVPAAAGTEGGAAEDGPSAGDASTAESVETGESTEAPSAPVRRAVLRVPAAQGLHRLDAATGEISPIEPVDEGFAGIETPEWQAIAPDAPAPGEEPPVASTPDSAPEPAAGTTGAGLPDEPGTRLTEVAAAASQEDEGRGRRAVIALLVLVAVLAVGVVCWFVIHQAGSSSAAGVQHAASALPGLAGA
ncbi:hypothetical protein [Actinomyces radicidentis]|uniref:hypothetical protein n=1 Tax=Actinomyces radicidentis TaxID=111015 RepID=UPI0028E9419F|nr:hypothetical protein [Actinomyces radicidentis]